MTGHLLLNDKFQFTSKNIQFNYKTRKGSDITSECSESY